VLDETLDVPIQLLDWSLVLRKHYESYPDMAYSMSIGSTKALGLLIRWITMPTHTLRKILSKEPDLQPTNVLIDAYLIARRLDIQYIKDTAIGELYRAFKITTDSFSIAQLWRIYKATRDRDQLRKFAAHHIAFNQNYRWQEFERASLEYPPEFIRDVAVALKERMDQFRQLTRLGK
jgi:hypothetical protein